MTTNYTHRQLTDSSHTVADRPQTEHRHLTETDRQTTDRSQTEHRHLTVTDRRSTDRAQTAHGVRQTDHRQNRDSSQRQTLITERPQTTHTVTDISQTAYRLITQHGRKAYRQSLTYTTPRTLTSTSPVRFKGTHQRTETAHIPSPL